jgi:23S rRNA (cytidine1920-2'-O)/16S rRNA (cytidine1409-2'-O)-methyltransferase
MSADSPFVSRGGLKLDHAFDTFGLDVSGMVCADFGCSTGGFTDCMLRRGASRVYALDTGYGVLDYRLRMDERVTVMERTNALHAEAPSDEAERPELIGVDMSWTVQARCVPAALAWLRMTERARIVTLVKPHYEAKGVGMEDRLEGGVLSDEDARAVTDLVVASLPDLGVRAEGVTRSPILGGKKKGKGNVEYLALLARA